jgi:hypothetical protein
MSLHHRLRSIDGVQYRPLTEPSNRTPRPPASTPSTAGLPRPFQFARPQQHTRPTIWDRLQVPLLILGGTFVGFFVQSLIFGVCIIALYSVFAFVFRFPSRATFMLAFMSLVTVVVLLVAQPTTALASNFATYTFLLLVIGVIALAIEARPPKKRKRRRKPVRG